MAGDSFLLAFHSELNENRINYNKEFFCTCDIIFCLFKSVVEAGELASDSFCPVVSGASQKSRGTR